jgi:DNA-binding NarL/FixJ family response regulator
MIKFALIDDNLAYLNLIKEDLKTFKDLDFCFMALKAQEALHLLEILQTDQLPDVLLVDIEMPEMDGIEATRQILALYPSIEVIMLTTFSEDDKIVKAIQNGAKGYLLKTEPASHIHRAIQEVYAGHSSLSPAIARKILNIFSQNPPTLPAQKAAYSEADYKLTPQEQKILDYVHQGYAYKRIGQELFIEESTVKKHIRNIYTKLGVHNKLEALNKLNGKRL